MIIWLNQHEWIRVVDYPSYRAWRLMSEGRVVEALPYLIKEWSSDEPITLKNCMRLSKKVVVEIQEHIIAKLRELWEIPDDDLIRYLRDFLRHPKTYNPNVRRFQNEKIEKLFEKYLPLAIIAVDHKGNIIHFPEPGGLLDQPLDWIKFLKAYKAAFIEYLNEEAKRQQRSRGPLRR